MKNTKLDYYIFIEELSEKIIKNIIDLKKKKLRINIIILEKNSLEISKFAKKERIPIFFKDNLKCAMKNKAQGIFLSSKNKNLKNNIKTTTKLKIIGLAHNQHEYYIKKMQNCTTIMLSPIFYNEKYSHNKILNVIKFNLITLSWKINICALGGINSKSIKLINLTKCKSVGVKSLIKE